MQRNTSSRLSSGKRLILSRRFTHRRKVLAGVAAAAAVAALLPTVAAVTPAEADDQAAAPTSSAGPVPELSTATSNTVREADGSLTMTAYTEPVNYRDSSGAWVPIDNTLVDAPGDVYDVQNAANSFTAKIPEDPSTTPIKLVDGGAWVAMQMSGIANQSAEVDNDTASFDHVAKADGVEYQVTNTGLKEAITLDAAPSAALHYTYTISASAGLTPTVEASGGIVFTAKDGSVAFTIPAGVMYDEDGGASDEVEYSLQSVGASWSLAVTPNMAWLTDTSRAYPVVIDPSLNGQNDVHDCNLRSAVPDNTACGNQTTYLKAGRSDSSHKYRGVFDFDVTSIPVAATVTNATVHLNLDQTQTLYQSQSADYALYATGKKFDGTATWNNSGVSGSWSGGSPGTTTYASKTMKGDTGGDKPFYGLEGLVQTWVSTPANNTGLVVKQVGETTNNILSFYSNSSSNAAAKRPYIDINYSFSPQTPAGLTARPCTDRCEAPLQVVDSLTPVLTASSDDSDSSSLTYTWQVRELGASTVLVTGTSSGAPNADSSWAVPAGSLIDIKQYEFRVSASDGSHSSSYSPWTAFATGVGTIDPAPADTEYDPLDSTDEADAADGFLTEDEEALLASASDVSVVAVDPSDPNRAATYAAAAAQRGLDGEFKGGRTPPPGGDEIPWSRWAACGVTSSRYKVVRDYEREKLHPRMERSYMRLYCGDEDRSGDESPFGYWHIKDRHQSQFETAAWAMGRQWQDLAGWMMDWISYDPELVTDMRADRFCYQRKFYFVEGDEVLLKKRVVLLTGRTGVRIMTAFFNHYGGGGYCDGRGAVLWYHGQQ